MREVPRTDGKRQWVGEDFATYIWDPEACSKEYFEQQTGIKVDDDDERQTALYPLKNDLREFRRLRNYYRTNFTLGRSPEAFLTWVEGMLMATGEMKED